VVVGPISSTLLPLKMVMMKYLSQIHKRKVQCQPDRANNPLNSEFLIEHFITYCRREELQKASFLKK